MRNRNDKKGGRGEVNSKERYVNRKYKAAVLKLSVKKETDLNHKLCISYYVSLKISA